MRVKILDARRHGGAQATNKQFEKYSMFVRKVIALCQIIPLLLCLNPLKHASNYMQHLLLGLH
jgi:hypothetical protein